MHAYTDIIKVSTRTCKRADSYFDTSRYIVIPESLKPTPHGKRTITNIEKWAAKPPSPRTDALMIEAGLGTSEVSHVVFVS